jgi:predicted RNase H-like HicB family nuclease
VRVESLRQARRAESLRVTLVQEEAPVLEALVWTVAELAGIDQEAAPMPEVPPAEDIEPWDAHTPGGEPPFPFWIERYALTLEGRDVTDYHISVFYSREDGGYVADIPELEACSAFGKTPEEAVAEVEVAKEAWLAAAREEGRPNPEPRYRR